MKQERIYGKIPKEDKEKVKQLVKKGLFESQSEFHKIAARRLLRDLEEYAINKKKTKKKILGTTDDKIMKEMEEIAKFADELF